MPAAGHDTPLATAGDTSSGKNDIAAEGTSNGIKPVAAPIHNDDYCGNCGLGGVLICCERCSFAFHFLCCTPPLNPDALPEEDWLCCQCSPREAGPAAFRSGKAAPALLKIAERFRRRNPTPFSPPKELVAPHKQRIVDEKLRKNAPSGEGKESTACFTCGQLVQAQHRMKCAFCPLVFHIDCLDQPRAQLGGPSWMCPNHPEHAMSRRKRARLSTQQMLPKNAPAETIKLQFLQRVLQERAGCRDGSDSSDGSAVSEDPLYARGREASVDDKHAFMSAVLQLQNEWWLRELRDQCPSQTTSPESVTVRTDEPSHVASAAVPRAVALAMDVDCMTERQRKDALLHLRRIVLNDARMRRRALDMPDPTPRALVPLVPEATEVAPVGVAAGSVATLRSTSTGEVFQMPATQYHIGMDVEGMHVVNLDLTKMNPPQTPEKLNAVIFYHDKAKAFEILNMAETTKQSIWVNGIEVKFGSPEATELPNNCVIEIVGLQFVFRSDK
eukprot:m.425268 g.425268  ORF g.425268 m.425268 type:complete len:500 (-) comp21345_c0_seq3:803-2302(-)